MSMIIDSYFLKLFRSFEVRWLLTQIDSASMDINILGLYYFLFMLLLISYCWEIAIQAQSFQDADDCHDISYK